MLASSPFKLAMRARSLRLMPKNRSFPSKRVAFQQVLYRLANLPLPLWIGQPEL